ncbi:unnamed protein product [Prorocentrum cordatum]|uniref:Selenoprotein O n=1 Tax=Prorocentrum cordatum TaxID=2364126 RepID=A0ABN9UX19_9DINO|nr:unnamed protein product [Polarella glacialis]
MFDSTGMGFDLVLTHKMLGITLDAELSFAPHAKATMAMGRSLFDELYQAAEAGGFPVRVLAAQVLIRIVPAVLAGAAVLAAVPNIESDLNSLQAYWARATLGYRRGPRLKWALSRLQCQWDLRLGTLMILQGHPATAMRDAARQSPLMASMPNGPIRDISANEGFTEEVALPALRAYDQPSVDALWASIDGGAPTTQQAANLALLGPEATADWIKYVGWALVRCAGYHTQPFRQRWFGGAGALSEWDVRQRIVRTLNFVKQQLDFGIHYVYPANSVPGASSV